MALRTNRISYEIIITNNVSYQQHGTWKVEIDSKCPFIIHKQIKKQKTTDIWWKIKSKEGKWVEKEEEEDKKTKTSIE